MDMTNEALITLCRELYEQGIPKIRIGLRMKTPLRKEDDLACFSSLIFLKG